MMPLPLVTSRSHRTSSYSISPLIPVVVVVVVVVGDSVEFAWHVERLRKVTTA